MGSKVIDTLFALSEVDSGIRTLDEERSGIEGNLESLDGELAVLKGKLAEVEARHEEMSLQQKDGASRLEAEEKKIVERRKQLSDLGGAKSAKLMEREIDIAARVIQTMEETALKAVEDLDVLSAQIDELKPRVEELETKYADEKGGSDKRLSEIEKEVAALNKKRQGSFNSLDDRLKRLYDRVTARYPGDAVAVAKEGACRSCFRALPAQTYNQILAGNTLIQCPGCSRILVYAGETEAAA